MAAGEVCVLIPTLNEASTIGRVIDGFVEEEFENVLVIDGHSTDDTVEIARDRGGEVMVQSGSGKGQAVREGLMATDARYVVLVDGDGTYRPSDAHRLLSPLREGEAEHVIGNRFGDLRPGAMTRLNLIGNRLINRVFAVIHGRNLEDVLSGYRAFTSASVDEMFLTADGFGIETEMTVECVRNDIPTEVVDITYQQRPGQSTTNLRPVRDGGVILSTLWWLTRTSNPLFFFGSLGSLSIIAATFVGGFVGYDWFARGVSHEVLAMLAAFGILIGFQLLTFGVISDLVVRLYR